MAFGIQTFDAAGKANNYGIVPVSLLSRIVLAADQVSGSWSFTVPSGFRIDYIHCPSAMAWTNTRRAITVSGNTISLSSAGTTNFGYGTEIAYAAYILVYLRND